MARRTITVEPLTRAGFAPFGQVIEAHDGAERITINRGMTTRFHDLADIELAGPGARPLVSIFRGRPYALPLTLEMMERHPLGSQAFVPLAPRPFLAIVAPDANGRPGTPRAFLTAPGQGVNIVRNTWHGVLTPLEDVSDFLVVDRGGEGENLQEHWFEEAFTVEVGIVGPDDRPAPSW